MRELLSLFLVVLMVFSLGMPAYATTTEEILKDNQQSVVNDAGDNSGEGTQEDPEGDADVPGDEEPGDAPEGDADVPGDEEPGDAPEGDADVPGDEEPGDAPEGDADVPGDEEPGDAPEGDADVPGDEEPGDAPEGDADVPGDEEPGDAPEGDADVPGDEEPGDAPEGDADVPGDEDAILPANIGTPEINSLSNPEDMEVINSTNHKPRAKNVQIQGTPYVGGVLTGTYDFKDYRWHSNISETYWYKDGVLIPDTQNQDSIDVIADYEGSEITFEVVPKCKVFIWFKWYYNTGETKSASVPILSRPEAQNVHITGTNQVGETLTGHWNYFDADGDKEGNSITYWYMNGEEIVGSRNQSELNVTEDMICEEITFRVRPHAINQPEWGDLTASKELPIEQPNFWITVDDGYELYINGEFISEDPVGSEDPDRDSWKTVDYYYLPKYEPGELTIAVKGMDQSEGSATIAGFIAAYNYNADCNDCDERCEDHWLITSDDWYIYKNETPPPTYGGVKWFEEDYKGYMKEEVMEVNLESEESDGWEYAHEIRENPWPNGWPVDHEYLEESDAEWIWSDVYKTSQEDPFDSPVYFRNTLELLSPPVASNLQINGTLRLGETLTGSYDYSDPDGEPEGDSELEWYLIRTSPTASVGISTAEQIGLGSTLLLDDHKYLDGEIVFKVRPVSQYDPKEGEKVTSDSVRIEAPHVWVVAYDDYSLYIDGELIGEDTVEEPTTGADVDYYYLDDRPVNPLIAVKAWMNEESTNDDSGLKLAYNVPVQDSASESLIRGRNWIITNGSWKTYTGGEPPVYENLDPDLHWYEPEYKGEGWFDAYSLGQSPSDYLTHSYLDPTMAEWIWTENYGDSVPEAPRASDASVDTPVYFRTQIELYDEDASILGITDDDLLLDEFTTVHVQLFNESSGVFIPNDPLLYNVQFFLDGVSKGQGTYDPNDDRYELTFQPPFSEYAQIVSATVNGVDVSNTVQLTVSKTPLEILSELTLDKSVVLAGDEITATIIVTDQYIENISGEIVEVIDDDGTPMATVEVSPGVHEVTYTPMGIGEHTVTYTVGSDLAEEEDYFQVVKKLYTLEHDKSTNGMTMLKDTYDSLVVLAQMVDYSIEPPAHLKVNIIELMQTLSMDYSLRNDNFESKAEVSWMRVIFREKSDEEPKPLPINYLASDEGYLLNTSDEVIGALGHVELTYPEGDSVSMKSPALMVTVEYDPSIKTPIVIAQTATYDWNYKQVRVIEVDPSENTFTLMLESWPNMAIAEAMYLEPKALVSYIVIESGVHEVSNGYIEAIKKVDPASLLPATHAFSQYYEDPDVLSQTQTYNDTDPVWMRQNHIMSNSVELFKQGPDHNLGHLLPSEGPVRISEDIETNGVDPHGEETIGILVLADSLLMHEVTFTNTYASSFDPQMVEHGTTATDPGTPSRSGYSFNGWTLDGSSFDITTDVVLEDIELVATWSSTGGGGGGGGGTTTATINAVNDTLVTDQDTPVSVSTADLMANDTDADDFESVQNPINGSVSLSGNTVTFTPAAGFVGTGYFSYTISDGGDEDNGLVSVTVEELVEINPFETPLGGDPEALILINPEETPLGAIDYSLPYILGYPDQSFKPNREITRGEMAAIFARILFLDTSNPGDPLYSDVKPDDWYYKYVQTVSRMGIFGGYEGTTFKPNRPITHAEIAAAFSEYWDLKGIEISDAGGNYSDIEGHWAEDAINRFFNAGISVGFMDGTFKPNSFTTRAELVVMVNRTLNRPELVDVEPTFPDVQPNYWGFGAIEAASKGNPGESAFKE